MIRTALLLCAGLLAAACFACVQAPIKPLATGPTCPTDNSPFLSHVAMLQTPYDPASFSAPSSSAASLTQAMIDDLTGAFQLAPLFFQQHLCNLDKIFIDPTACGDDNACRARSWGFRDFTGHQYIGISSSLWLQGNAPLFFDYMTGQLRLLLNQSVAIGSAPPTWGASNPPYFTSQIGQDPSNPSVINDPANTSAMTTLAALAHELGHVRWYVATVPALNGMYHGPYNFQQYLIPCQTDTASFFRDSWRYYNNNTAYLQTPNSWRRFAAPGDDLTLNHPTQPKNIHQITRPGTIWNLANNLATIYATYQPWASLQAWLAPDEDFVETYVFDVLTKNAQLPTHPPVVQSLQLQIPFLNPPAAGDVPWDYFNNRAAKANFVRKVDCVDWTSQNL
jgi:hypothetical protein